MFYLTQTVENSAKTLKQVKMFWVFFCLFVEGVSKANFKTHSSVWICISKMLVSWSILIFWF